LNLGLGIEVFDSSETLLTFPKDFFESVDDCSESFLGQPLLRGGGLLS